MTNVSPKLFQATALAVGLETYVRHRIQVNRMWTPVNMMRTASSITGKKFKPRDYAGAAKALRAWVSHERDQGRA